MKLLLALAVLTLAGYGLAKTVPMAWLDEAAWPRLTQPLQVATAAGVALVTGGTHAGPVITVGPERYHVTPECSGLRKLVLLAGTALLIAWTLPWPPGLALLAAVLPLTVGLNVARVAATVWLTPQGAGWHTAIGVAGYSVALGGLLLVAGRRWR